MKIFASKGGHHLGGTARRGGDDGIASQLAYQHPRQRGFSPPAFSGHNGDAWRERGQPLKKCGLPGLRVTICRLPLWPGNAVRYGQCLALSPDHRVATGADLLAEAVDKMWGWDRGWRIAPA